MNDVTSMVSPELPDDDPAVSGGRVVLEVVVVGVDDVEGRDADVSGEPLVSPSPPSSPGETLGPHALRAAASPSAATANGAPVSRRLASQKGQAVSAGWTRQSQKPQTFIFVANYHIKTNKA